MATKDVKRKLTAIFSADVEGYSRLMGEDELATIETLFTQTLTDTFLCGRATEILIRLTRSILDD